RGCEHASQHPNRPPKPHPHLRLQPSAGRLPKPRTTPLPQPRTTPALARGGGGNRSWPHYRPYPARRGRPRRGTSTHKRSARKPTRDRALPHARTPKPPSPAPRARTELLPRPAARTSQRPPCRPTASAPAQLFIADGLEPDPDAP